MTPALLTADEVAAILRFSRAHVYAIRHRIGFVQMGRALRFHPDTVQRFIESQTRGVPEKIAGLSVRELAGEESRRG